MILVAENILCEKLSIGTAAGTVVSTNLLDFGKGTGRNLNPKRTISAICVDKGTITGTGYMVTAKIQGTNDDVDDTSVTPTWTDYFTAPAVSIGAGAFPLCNVSLSGFDKRFVRVAFTVTIGTGTSCSAAPKVTAFVHADDAPLETTEYDI